MVGRSDSVVLAFLIVRVKLARLDAREASCLLPAVIWVEVCHDNGVLGGTSRLSIFGGGGIR